MQLYITLDDVQIQQLIFFRNKPIPSRGQIKCYANSSTTGEVAGDALHTDPSSFSFAIPTTLPIHPVRAMPPAIEQPRNIVRALAVLSLVLWTLGSTAPMVLAGDKPLPSQSEPCACDNEILLINTRVLGACSKDTKIGDRLQCEKYVKDPDCKHQWISGNWRDIISESTAERQTIIYIHGNRVCRGEDRTKGMQVYRSLVSRCRPKSPVRFIIWSWPSARIPGPVKDYKTKARRTCPSAWQLAWFLDQLPANSRVSLLGYSYGARIASGAMHILGGGSLGSLKLDQRVHPQRNPIRVGMMAAAFDANWMQPRHFHGRALSQIERLVVVTNRLDPIMRFYHLSNGRGHIDALGKRGMSLPQTLGSVKRSVRQINFTHTVGRSHSLADYLAASGMRSVWSQLLASDTSTQHASLQVH